MCDLFCHGVMYSEITCREGPRANSRASTRSRIYRYEGFTVDFVPLRAFTFCSGRIRNEDDRAVAYYVYSYVARSGAECSTQRYVTQNNR